MGILDKLQGKETVKETKILLHLIKNSNFKGDSVELVYNLTKKLQSVLGILTED